jgi:sugar phosphate isomerase/epimerase
MRFMSIRDLPQSLRVLERTDRPNAAVLIDLLHLVRTGGTVADVASIDADRLPYVQLCDAPHLPPEDLYTEAIDGRLLTGDGELPIVELVDVLPAHTALSMEIRSAALRSAWPDPVDRARHVLDATTRVLA